MGGFFCERQGQENFFYMLKIFTRDEPQETSYHIIVNVDQPIT